MQEPQISIVIPTKNSEKTFKSCLKSIQSQTYQNYEIIVVDCFSTDNTATIAKQFTDKFFVSNCGCAEARNLGFSKASGNIFLSLDSDMIMEKTLLKEILVKMNGYGGLVIPEIGHGTNFLSKCKDLEKRCYLGDETIESARVFSAEAFFASNCYDKDLVIGEDRDLHCRIRDMFSIGRTEARLLHNTEYLSLFSNLKKAYNYGKSFHQYMKKDRREARRWYNLGNLLFIRHFSKLTNEPIYALGLFFIKTMEYVAGLIGFLTAKLKFKGEQNV